MAKRCRTLLDGDCGDYISKLPEGIVGHILSRLMTKEAVKTCVLSRDWEYKWTNIYSFTINDSAAGVKNPSIFVDFMDRIVRVSLSHHVKHFSLSCNEKYDVTRMTAWVSPILGPNLETFILSLHQKDFVIPQSLLNCTSLKTLFLKSHCTFRVPAHHTFPNLRDLFLYHVWVSNENSNDDTMVLQFPALKELHLHESKWLNLKYVEIHAPSLDMFTCKTTFSGDVHGCSLKFVGAIIGLFQINGHVQDTFVLSRSTVSHASLNCSLGVCKLLLQKLFNELSSITQLSLNGSTVKAYEQLDLRHTCYEKLEEIKITNGADLNGLLNLLRIAPNLKFRAVPGDKVLDHIEYNDVEIFPYCISSSLEKVKFAYSSFTPVTQVCFVMFILKFGARLKNILFTIDASRRNDIFMRLSKLHMASPNVEITEGY